MVWLWLTIEYDTLVKSDQLPSASECLVFPQGSKKSILKIFSDFGNQKNPRLLDFYFFQFFKCFF